MTMTLHPLMPLATGSGDRRRPSRARALALLLALAGSAGAASPQAPEPAAAPAPAPVPASVVSTNLPTPAAEAGVTNPAAPQKVDVRPEASGRSPGETPSKGSKEASPLAFASFKVISDRNIFNPGRTRRSGGGDGAPAPKPKVVETLSLVGTMTYDKGDLAFFDGSSATYRKALRTNDVIAGYQVVGIARNTVRLTREGKGLELSVGGKLRREDEGEWTVAETGAAKPGSSETSSASSDDDSKSEGGAESDILKRLMQKREQEMKNEKE